MAAKKIKDAVVVVGEYQNQRGETKKRYANVGALIQFDDGGQQLILDRHFNPAGVVGDACRIYFNDPRPFGGQQDQSAPQRTGQAESDDDVPF